MASSKFVSSGTTDNPIEKDDEWQAAREEIENKRRLKEEEARQNGGKTLYETLQANKGGDLRCMLGSIRLKNQFRSLDEDEVEFLDTVLESTRSKEAALRKETTEQLELFRRQQEEIQKASVAEEDDTVNQGAEEQWNTTGKKRKKGTEKDSIRGVKLRKSSSTAGPDSPFAKEAARDAISTTKTLPATKPAVTLDSSNSTKPPSNTPARALPKAAPSTALGLGDYSSDDD